MRIPVCALVLAAAGIASAAPPVAPTPAPASALSALLSRPRLHGRSGTIEGYDSAARILTVRTAKGLWTFAVATARVWIGSRSVGLEDLASTTGDRVSVKYSDADGQRVATTVRVAVPKHPSP